METAQSSSIPRYSGDFSDEDYREWYREFGPRAAQAVSSTMVE